MSFAKPEMVRSFYADAAITARKAVVASDANPQAVEVPPAATRLGVIGVTVGPSDTNGWVPVAMGGVVEVTAGGTIAVGDTLGFDTSGQAVAITPAGSGTTLRGMLGTALSAAASGEIVLVALNPGYCQV